MKDVRNGFERRTEHVNVYFEITELDAVRERAASADMTLSEALRTAGLHPVRLPERARITGVAAMDSAGSDLGHAIRGEDGLGPVDVPACARRLRDAILVLRVERTREPLPAGAYVWEGGKQERREARRRAASFWCTPSELRTMREVADAYRMPLSVYVRRRAAGTPLQPREQPIEGLRSVRRCIGLLMHAAMSTPAWDAAIMRMREAALEHMFALLEEAV